MKWKVTCTIMYWQNLYKIQAAVRFDPLKGKIMALYNKLTGQKTLNECKKI